MENVFKRIGRNLKKSVGILRILKEVWICISNNFVDNSSTLKRNEGIGRKEVTQYMDHPILVGLWLLDEIT